MRTFQWSKTVDGVKTPTHRMVVEPLTRELYEEFLVPNGTLASENGTGSYEDVRNNGFTEVAWVPLANGHRVFFQALRAGKLPTVDRLLECVEEL
jgi:hypothetical protein